jgi:manganese-dependent inorganic pyrophosphatase
VPIRKNMDKIYIIGHKNPDLDSVAAAISYADYKNKIENTDAYKPAVPGEINLETKYALEKFNMDAPELLEDASGKILILIDHNEFSQSANNIENAKIVEILDHHKMDFKSSEPILIDVRPWGSSAGIVASKYFEKDIAPDKNLAGLMLSAILVDTVITKSPTCTEIDKEIIKKISAIAGIDGWKEFGLEIFRVRSSVKNMAAADIVKSDFKDFALKAGKFGIGQVETVDLSEFADKENELMDELENLRQKGSYHTTILFMTDIINEGSKFLVSSSDQEKIGKALGADLKDGKAYIEGIISRKKQVAPKFVEVFDK